MDKETKRKRGEDEIFSLLVVGGSGEAEIWVLWLFFRVNRLKDEEKMRRWEN
ncbi:hypothetical protein ACFL6I_22455 [candidate division KSB1 bacterium]